MRQKLYNEIKKERPNQSWLGAYNTAVASGEIESGDKVPEDLKEEWEKVIAEYKYSGGFDVKSVLSENRDSIISSIKYTFKIYDKNLIKQKMVDFLKYAQDNPEQIKRAKDAKNTKTLLKSFIMNMAYQNSKPQREIKQKEEEERNLRMYGTKKPKLRDLMSYSASKEEDKGNVWNPVTRRWEKRRY